MENENKTNTEFLREKIKEKPINKRKLLRRTLISLLTAAVFGLVACLTFIFLEPLISSKLNRNTSEVTEPEVSQVTLSDNEDEISPEDMYATDSEMIEEALQGNVSEVNEDIQKIESMISDISFDVEDYRSLYKEMADMSDTLSASVVTVTGFTTNTDALSSTYDSSASLSGVIVANNGQSLLILAKDKGLTDSDTIEVTFCDGSSTDAAILGKDDTTGYMILAVSRASLSDTTLDLAQPANLGTSRATTLRGTPVMALGSPTGVTDSVAYGMITSAASQLDMTDSDYMLMTTDITGTPESTGVIFNLRGYVIGIIDNSFDSSAPENVICALGITELKPLIEKLSNQSPKAYLGIHAMDITSDMKNAYDLPDGIYISSVEVDSPAMNAGLQNGDILVGVGNEVPNSYHDFIEWLYDATPDTEVTFSIRRQSVDNYIPLTLTVTLGEISYTTEE